MKKTTVTCVAIVVEEEFSFGRQLWEHMILRRQQLGLACTQSAMAEELGMTQQGIAQMQLSLQVRNDWRFGTLQKVMALGRMSFIITQDNINTVPQQPLTIEQRLDRLEALLKK